MHGEAPLNRLPPASMNVPSSCWNIAHPEEFTTSAKRCGRAKNATSKACRAPARDPLAAMINGRPVVGGAVEDPHGSAGHVGLVDQPGVATRWIERRVSGGRRERAAHEASLVPRLARPQRHPAAVRKAEDADAPRVD